MDELVSLDTGCNREGFEVLAKVWPVDTVEDSVSPFSFAFDILAGRICIDVEANVVVEGSGETGASDADAGSDSGYMGGGLAGLRESWMVSIPGS